MKSTLLFTLLLFISMKLFSQDSSQTILEEVLITSRKTNKNKSNLSNSITVLNAKSIDELRTISSNPADILALSVPGLGPSSGTSSNWR